MLRAIADSPELYLAVEVSGDYARLLRRVVSKQFLVEGRGVEPPSVAGSALRPASPLPLRGPAPSHAPHEGGTPPSNPPVGVSAYLNVQDFGGGQGS